MPAWLPGCRPTAIRAAAPSRSNPAPAPSRPSPAARPAVSRHPLALVFASELRSAPVCSACLPRVEYRRVALRGSRVSQDQVTPGATALTAAPNLGSVPPAAGDIAGSACRRAVPCRAAFPSLGLQCVWRRRLPCCVVVFCGYIVNTMARSVPRVATAPAMSTIGFWMLLVLSSNISGE